MSWIKTERNRTTFFRLLSPGPNEQILDVGAGRGDVAAIVQQTWSGDVYALDPDRKRIESAQKNHPNLKVCLSGSESIPYPDGFFDKAYSTLAVHHFTDQQRSFRELARVLKPGGVLVIIDIIPQSFMGRLGRFLENGLMRAHLKFLTLDQMVGMLKQEGEFTVKEAGAEGAGYFVQAVKTAASAS